MAQEREFELGGNLKGLVEGLVASYRSDGRTHHINKRFLPSHDHNLPYHVGELLSRVAKKLYRQIYNCLCHEMIAKGKGDPESEPCDAKAEQITLAFLGRLPAIREMLAGDVQAAYDGDPAATGTDEVILAYPGFLAVTVYRLAHELHTMGVPLMPRMMTEWAHSVTGVDIHPGAKIGRNFFIDHATGVVIGETTEIGDNVKIYQGVTLGALSFPKDERGRLIRGHKRHPTIEDDVVIYANATVLGGSTRIGRGSTIGGSVFLTRSVPAECTVTMKPPELRFRSKIRNGSEGPNAGNRTPSKPGDSQADA